ncbi:MAG: hypothetical protein SGILL_005882 [Bacillariaceae sp.]
MASSSFQIDDSSVHSSSSSHHDDDNDSNPITQSQRRPTVKRTPSMLQSRIQQSVKRSPSHANMALEESTMRMPDVMASFLEDFLKIQDRDSVSSNAMYSSGDVSATAHGRVTLHGNPPESILESEYDLTEERLRYVFDVFDQDEDGRIDYESLRRGLQYHSSSDKTHVDDMTFERLAKFLDLDESGDISFEEFSEGVRLLILRGLLKHANLNKEAFMTEVFDYDAQRLERHIINEDRLDIRVSVSFQSMSLYDFYFQERPDWVGVRWVNIHDVQSRVLERMGVKYRLHPLAIEDALDPENHRPKAESYSSHYFLMVPLFHLQPLDLDLDRQKRKEEEMNVFRKMWRRCCRRVDNFRGVDDLEEEARRKGPRMGKISVQTASVFICLPEGNTIITYIRENSTHSGYSTWERVQKELKKSYSKLRQYDAQYLSYSLLDEAVDLIGPIIQKVKKEIRKERELLKATQYKDLDTIHEIGAELRTMNRKMKPFIRLLEHVIEDDKIPPGPTVFLRDVLDNLSNFGEELREVIRHCANIDVEAEKYQQRQMDATLYTLTVISAVFLPAQFLTGVW